MGERLQPLDPDRPLRGGDEAIGDALLALLAARDAHVSVCPSEVARLLDPDEHGWRALMPRVRRVAVTLACLGRVRITRGGEDVPPREIDGGPIRLSRGPAFDHGAED